MIAIYWLLIAFLLFKHFQTAMAENAQMAKIYEDKRGSFVRDTFGLVSKHQTPTNHQSNMSNVNVVITDVAWSKPQPQRRDNAITPELIDDQETGARTPSSSHHKKQETAPVDSIVAAAGSNGKQRLSG